MFGLCNKCYDSLPCKSTAWAGAGEHSAARGLGMCPRVSRTAVTARLAMLSCSSFAAQLDFSAFTCSRTFKTVSSPMALVAA